MDMQLRWCRQGDHQLPLLIWRFPAPVRAVASAPHGGGLGTRRWIVNAQVPASYGRRDPDRHLGKLGVSLGLPGRGVGMLTAADVQTVSSAVDGGVEAAVTVGLGHPTRAAAPDAPRPVSLVGTINAVVWIPERLSDAALVNAVATATEAKSQALWDKGIAAHRARRPSSWATVEVGDGGDLAGCLLSTTGTVLVDSLGTWVATRGEDDDALAVDGEKLADAIATRDGDTVVVSEEVGMSVH